MSDDLVQRLRGASLPITLEMAMEGYVQDTHAVALHVEAADCIERLEAELDVAHGVGNICAAERDEARAENTKLREALSNLLDCVEEGPFSSHEQCGSAPAARALLADTRDTKSPVEADDADG